MVETAFGDTQKSELFFKLHELQTQSWGASEIGKVTQPPIAEDAVFADDEGSKVIESVDIDVDVDITIDVHVANETAVVTGMPSMSGDMRSSVDLILLPLTSVPLVGFGKLLPTFGGSVVTAAAVELRGQFNEVLVVTVNKTEVRSVPNLKLMPLLGPLLAGRSFPTGDVVSRALGAVPKVRATVRYLDDEMRVMDVAGQTFVYYKAP
ncbi:unnamed protein product [Phaeothamnion confervicola]